VNPTVSLPVGSYTITLTVTDDEGATGTDEVTVTVNSPVTNPDQIIIEAECASVIGGDWTIASDGSASGDQYAVVESLQSIASAPIGADSRLLFNVEIGQAASYHLFARVRAPSSSSDSYWVRINGGNWIRWWQGLIRGSQFNWNEVTNSPFALQVGNNTIEFAYRESNTQLDKLQLNLDGALPTGLGGPEGCSGVPEANIVASTTEGLAPLTVNFDGSNSRDTDGSIISYAWNFGVAGATASGAQAIYTFADPGVYTVSLTVTDDEGQSDTENLLITALDPTPANQGPVADAGADQTVVDADDNGSEEVTLDGSGSTDSDGTIASYVWSESGTQLATGVNPTVSLPVGSYTITLTVTDDDGATGNDNILVTVDTPVPTIPVANAGPDQLIIDSDENGTEEVALDGTASSDADGSIVSYEWSVSGSVIATGANPLVILPIGTTSILLVVTDNDGNTDSDEVEVTIEVPNAVEEYTLYVNFSNDGFSPQEFVAPWNYTGRATRDNPIVNDLKDENGQSTGVSLRLFASTANGDRWNGSSNNGVNGTLYPSEVMESYYFVDFWSPVTMTLEGLNPALFYDFTFYGGTNESNRSAEYSINGQTVTLNTSANATETATIAGIVPTAAGNINITVGTGSSFRAVLNAMVVNGYLTATPAAMTSNSPKAVTTSTSARIDTEEFGEINLELLPNPTSFDNIQLSISNYDSGTSLLVELVNASGTLIMSQRYNTKGQSLENVRIEVADPINGVYFVRVTQGSSVVQKRLIVY
jgi:PKD repeat protein